MSFQRRMKDRHCARTSNRLNCKRRFLVTGFSLKERERLANVVRKLGGEYIDERAFKEQCTHLICEMPNRSEKFLGACAIGIWIVKSSYVNESARVGSWVAEEAHEWTNNGIGDVKHPFLYRAPRRWRTHVGQTKRRAFDTWRVILLVDDANKKIVFRRLLEAGGAMVVICKLPPKVDHNITHIFVNTKYLSYDYLIPWKVAGVPCLAPDFIGDFLVEDERPSLCSRDIFLSPIKTDNSLEVKIRNEGANFKSKDVTRKKLVVKLEDCLNMGGSKHDSRNSNLCALAVKDVQSPRPSKVSNKQEPFKSEAVIGCGPLNAPTIPPDPTTANQLTTLGSSKSLLTNLVVQIERVDVPETSSDDDCRRRKTASDQNNNPKNRQSPSRGQDSRLSMVDDYKMDIGKISPTEKERKENVIAGSTDGYAESSSEEEMMPACLASPRSALKRRCSSDSNQAPFKRARRLKRRCSSDSNPAPFKRARRYEDILMTLDQQSGLCGSCASPLPVSLCVEELFNTCYEEAYYHLALDEFQRYLSSSKYPTAEMMGKMMAMLFSSTDLQLSEAVYSTMRRLLSLHPPNRLSLQCCYLRSMQFANNSAWAFLTTVIDSCKKENLDVVSEKIVDPDIQVRNSMLLLEYLATVLNLSVFYCENSQEKMVPIFADVLWTSTDMGDLNYRVRYLMNVAVDATTSNEAAKLRRLLYSLLISAFRTMQFVCKERQLNVGRTELFISELTKMLTPQTCDFKILDKIIAELRDTVLGIGVCCSVLDTLDNFSFVDCRNDVSLGKILDHYLYCVPKKVANRSVMNRTKVETIGQRALLSRSLVATINKRNMKGETKLQRACIRGDATMVRMLLSIPGIDINSQDYAGWTALHEACNAGHQECVQLLLDYRPPKTIDNYFSNSASQRKTVNLFLRDPEGTTPLHDAVLNCRLEVARLLVRYGGRRLLEERNAAEQTPVDLADSEEMLEALVAPDEIDDTYGNQSQFDSSQSSTLSEDLNEIYAQTGSADCTNVQDCRRFLLLFECLLLSYLHVENLIPTPNGLEPLNHPEQRYLKRVPKYMHKLKRHIQKIVVDEAKESDVFSDIFDRLEILTESYYM